MKKIYMRHFCKLWVLCFCLSIFPDSFIHAAPKVITKTPGTPIGPQLSSISTGDTVVIRGDTLQHIDGSFSDWWDMGNTISATNLVLILETENKRVPGYQMNKMKLTSVVLPNIETLMAGAFFQAPDLVSAYLPKALKLDTNAFFQAPNLKIVDLPEVKLLGPNAFYQCPVLTTVNLPEVQTIDDNAFQFCPGLTDINFPKLETIGDNAFDQCVNLTTIGFPNLQTMGVGAFSNCDNLTSATLPKATIIGDQAFNHCTVLSSVDVPNAVTIGASAFADCPVLTNIDLPKAVIIGNNAFNQSGLAKISAPNVQTIGNWAFFETKLSNVNFPNVQTIGDYAFKYCANLTNVNLPKVQAIAEGAFFKSGLTTISLPNVETVGNYALDSCLILTNVSFPKAKAVGNNGLANCPLLATASLPVVEILGNGAFQRSSALSGVGFPNLKDIGEWVFKECTNLTSADFPKVETIGANAFDSCLVLANVSFPNVQTIKYQTFKDCVGLTTVDLPNVKTLSNDAFINCGSLEIILLHKVTSMTWGTFKECRRLKYMELGNPPTLELTTFENVGPVLIVVPDTTVYPPSPLLPDYSHASEAHLRKVTTEKRLFNPESPETLISARIPNPSLSAGGTYAWRKDGYPISHATGSMYTPTEPGWYTLEFTHGGTITLLSVYLAADEFELFGSHARYEDCSYTLVLTFTPANADRTVTVKSQGSGAAYVIDAGSKKLFADGLTYNLPKNKTILEIPYGVAEDMDEDNQVEFTWKVSSNPIINSTDVFTLYATPKITLLRYYQPTTQFAGLLEIGITGGSPYMERSRDGGKTWELARDINTGEPLSFSKSQIKNLDEPYLLFRVPNACTPPDTLTLHTSGGENPILREVLLPTVKDAVCSVEAGVHNVESLRDFTFTLTGVKPGYSPRISTSRTLYPDSEGGLLIERNDDGSYTVTIRKIQEPVVVSIDFSVGIASVESTRVWTFDGVLHVQPINPCEIFIYTFTGALVKCVRLSAGENFSLTLTKGCYFVTIDKKTYKVIL